MPRKREQTGEISFKTLRWVPPKGLKRTYDLYSGDEIIGRLHWPNLFGSLAEAEFGGQRWTFKRGGFLRPRVTVREASSGTDFAVLAISWSGGGVLTMTDGARFRWERQGFWAHSFVLTTPDGVELLRFEPNFGLVRRTGTVMVGQAAARMAEFGMLVALGWYVIMLIADDEAAAAIAVCCS